MQRKPSRPQELLKFFAVGSGIVALSLVAPQLPAKLLREYLRQKRFQRNRFLQDLRRLQSRELIELREHPAGIVKIILKRRGKEVALTFTLEGMNIKKPLRWDEKWRLIIFDIPENKKHARNTLQMKLKELNFYALQKSVFIHPYPCEDEIDFISQIFDVRDHILLLTVDDFEGSEKLLHHFGL